MDHGVSAPCPMQVSFHAPRWRCQRRGRTPYALYRPSPTFALLDLSHVQSNRPPWTYVYSPIYPHRTTLCHCLKLRSFCVSAASPVLLCVLFSRFGSLLALVLAFVLAFVCPLSDRVFCGKKPLQTQSSAAPRPSGRRPRRRRVPAAAPPIPTRENACPNHNKIAIAISTISQ